MTRRIKAFFLFLISFPPVSRLWGRITRIQRPAFLVRLAVRTFARHYGIDMKQFRGRPEDYPSLSRFFLRPLDPETCPLNPRDGCILSPADGSLQTCGICESGHGIQAKGVEYALSDLVGTPLSGAWRVLTIYLSPSDYHRFHYPLTAKITRHRHLRGRLYPVNALGLQTIRGLFIKNERVSVEFQQGDHTFYLVAVGACLVGGLHLTLPGGIQRDGAWHPSGIRAPQMKEMGHFAMGSTVILLLPPAMAEPLDILSPGHKIFTGQPLLHLRD